MLVTVLLAAALLALEREEGVFARLRPRAGLAPTPCWPRRSCSPPRRRSSSRCCSSRSSASSSRSSFQPLALAAGALAFAALGTALGALAREVRVASLLAVLLALPLAFLALIPSGAVERDALRRAQHHLRRLPVQADAARARRRRARAYAHLVALAAAYGPSRAWRSAGSKLAPRWPFPPPACAACARPACCAASSARRSCPYRHLVYPMFVTATGPKRTPIAELPGIDHLSIDGAVEEAGIAHALGHPGRAALRPAGEQGPRGLRRVGRRGRDPARHARDQGRAPGPARLHRPLPVRVHLARPLRRAARRRRRRQRPDARAARAHRGLAGRGGRGRRRAQRHDGRPRGRAARRARRPRADRDAADRLLRQVRVRLLRPVPRGRRLARRSRATARATRWIRPTRSRPCARPSSTPTRAPTS